MRRTIFILLILVMCLSVGPAGAGIRDEYAGHVRDMHRQFLALESIWYRMLMDLPGRDNGDGPQVLRLRLEKALFLFDMEIEVIRWGDTWLPGRAWCDELWFHPQQVAVKSFGTRMEKKKEVLSARLEIKLERADGWDRDMTAQKDLGKWVMVPGTIVIDANVTPKGYAGKFRFEPLPIPKADPDEAPDYPMPKNRGTVTGSLKKFSGVLQPRHTKPPYQWKKDSVYRLFSTAMWLETLVDRRYHELRAMALAARKSIPYHVALRECRQRFVRRSPIKDPEARKKAQQEKRGIKLDEIEDDDLGLGLDEGEAPPEKKKPDPAKDPQVPRTLKTLARMASRARKTVALLTAFEKRKNERLDVAVDGLDPGDPLFGPWYESAALVFDSKQGRHKLPDDVGTDGPQCWPPVGSWKLLGPFSMPAWEHDTPMLQEAVFDFGASYVVDRDRMLKGGAVKAGRTVSWKDTKQWTAFGYIVPPDWSKQNRYSTGTSAGISGRPVGIEYSSFYAATEIESPMDVELWTAVGMNQRIKLWLDGELYWMGPSEVDYALLQDMQFIKLKLHKGVNKIMLRCDVDRSSPFFWMRVCTKGKPRSAEEVKAHAGRVAAQKKTISELTASGYRGNFTGRFPNSHTPAAWNYKTGHNTRWFTPLEYWSNASPALAKDRLFVAIEPHWLVCLAKADGKELWRKPVTVLEMLDEANRKKGWDLYNAWWKARFARDSLPNHMERPHKWLRYSRYWKDYKPYWQNRPNIWLGKAKDEREGASEEMIALLDRRDELEKAEDPQSVQEELTALLKKIDKLKEKDGDPVAKEVSAKSSAAGKTWGRFIDFLGEHSVVRGMSGYWYDYDGYAFATPVTDGEHVWWKNGMDAVACFDMDGNRKWIKQIKGGGAQSATVSSPILLDGPPTGVGRKMLVFKTPEYAQRKMRGKMIWRKKRGSQQLTAMEPYTGKEIWTAKGLPKFGMDWTANTPACLTLTNGKDKMRVLVVSGGSVVRADDGKVLVKTMGGYAADSSVVPLDDIVVFPRPHLAAFRLIMVDRDTVGCELLWMHQMGTHGVGYHGTLVTDDGYVCHETRFGHYWKPWPCETENGPGEDRISLIVKDLVTGEMTKGLQMHRKGASYWSLHTQTADHIAFIGGDTIFRGKSWPKPAHTMTVLSRGPEPVALGRNAIDRTYGGAAYDEENMYLRGYGGVWCVGYTGKSGRAYEAKVIVDNILDEISVSPPRGAPEPLVPEGVKSPLRKGVHGALAEFGRYACRIEDNRAPHTWMMAGPLPIGEAKAALAALGGGKKQPRPDRKLGPSGKPFKLLNSKYFRAGSGKDQLQHQNHTIIDRQRRVIPMDRIVQKPGTVSYLYAEYNDNPRRGEGVDKIMRFEMKTPGARAWIGGLPLKDGDRVLFRKGSVYGLLIELKVESIPADGIMFSPRFYNAADPKAEAAAWRKFVTTNRKHLDNVIALAPDSPQAKRARTVLEQL